MIDVDYYLLLLIIDLSINDVWIYISGQTDLVHRLGKSVYAKVRNDIFCPEFAVTFCTDHFHLPKNSCKSLKLVSKIASKEWIMNFRLDQSDRVDRTTF